jgi:hypothetical protein
MYSFDHDLGHFVSIGPATVSEDGSAITSNPGVGILKAGWHCGGNPASAGAPHDCPGCLICNGNQCVLGCRLGAASSSPLVVMPKAAPSCCTPKDPCETKPGTCLPGGGCKGVPVEVTAVGGACIVEQGMSTTFTAQSNEPSKVNWSAIGGNPASGKGPSFSIQFGSPGQYTVTASCKNSQSKTVEVARDCASITPQYLPVKIDPYPPVGNSFGSVQPLSLQVIALPCATGGQWCLRLSQLHLSYGFGINGGGNIDVNSADDPVVTALTCSEIIADLDPPPPGTPNGPDRTKYWSSTITTTHEQKHEVDYLKKVADKTYQEIIAFAADPARCSGCSKPSPAAVIREAAALYKSNYNTYLLTAEEDAHDVSNALYANLVIQIRVRAQSEGWTQCE